MMIDNGKNYRNHSEKEFFLEVNKKNILRVLILYSKGDDGTPLCVLRVIVSNEIFVLE